MLAALLRICGNISSSLKEITELKSPVTLYLTVKIVLSAPCGIRTHGLSLRSFTDFGLILWIFTGYCGFLSEKIGHYVDICRFESTRVDGFY